MASKQSLKRAGSVGAPPPEVVLGHQVTADGATVFHEEDGWVFSERPGKGITCVGRSEPMPQPYVGRHHYPSAG